VESSGASCNFGFLLERTICNDTYRVLTLVVSRELAETLGLGDLEEITSRESFLQVSVRLSAWRNACIKLSLE